MAAVTLVATEGIRAGPDPVQDEGGCSLGLGLALLTYAAATAEDVEEGPDSAAAATARDTVIQLVSQAERHIRRWIEGPLQGRFATLLVSATDWPLFTLLDRLQFVGIPRIFAAAREGPTWRPHPLLSI